MQDKTQDKPTDTELVRAFQALPDDYADNRERAISSLRLFAEPADYDLMLSAGDLSGAEIDVWDTTL